ncbi:hypothetical protein OPV22_001232 [Ensete ventricosum]|uniref:Uncharacterized protein n=1 Tax=Ensete ventricosum TaxID=4639 RepID=A0AAV8RT58_ENSVE|nr:hypothetical protein OPV22_001232 [Ensete ventricosum]
MGPTPDSTTWARSDAGPAPHHPFDAVAAELISSVPAHGPPSPPTWRVSVFRASLPSPPLPSNQPTDQSERVQRLQGD